MAKKSAIRKNKGSPRHEEEENTFMNNKKTGYKNL